MRTHTLSTRICCLKFESELCSVIACDKRKAFAQGSICDEAIQLCRNKAGLLRGACHRAALCADPLARNDVDGSVRTADWRRALTST
jgi:hypothetical protein